MRSSKRFWRLRAMNSCNAFVTAAFFVRSPLTSRACSIRSGSIERLVALCETPQYEGNCKILQELRETTARGPALRPPRLRERDAQPTRISGDISAIQVHVRSCGAVVEASRGLQAKVVRLLAKSRFHKGAPAEGKTPVISMLNCKL